MNGFHIISLSFLFYSFHYFQSPLLLLLSPFCWVSLPPVLCFRYCICKQYNSWVIEPKLCFLRISDYLIYFILISSFIAILLSLLCFTKACVLALCLGSKRLQPHNFAYDCLWVLHGYFTFCLPYLACSVTWTENEAMYFCHFFDVFESHLIM